MRENRDEQKEKWNEGEKENPDDNNDMTTIVLIQTLVNELARKNDDPNHANCAHIEATHSKLSFDTTLIIC